MGLDNFLHDLITEADSNIYAISDILHFRAERTPHEIAFIYLRDGENDEEKLSYKDLHDSANDIARRLNTMNLKGERVLLLYPPGLEFIKSLFACFYAFALAVPAYPPRKNRSIDRIKKLVDDSGATAILTINEIYQSFNRSFSDVEELRQLKWIVIDDSENEASAVSLTQGPASFPCPEDIALLQYTSGSTGNPKGVIITHRNITRNCEYIRNSFGFSRNSVGVSWLPTFHDMGLVGQVFQPVYTGFPSIFMSPVSFFQKPVRWLKAFSKYRGTMGGAPNFAYDLLAESTTKEDRNGLDLSSIKTIYCGAEPIRKSTFEKFIEAYEDYGLKPSMLYPCYGMAETTLITSGPPSGRGPVYLSLSGNALLRNTILPVPDVDKDAKSFVGVGYPWLDTAVLIVNPETSIPCNTGEIGEIWISGSSVSPGYWNKQGLNQEIFSAQIPGDSGSRYLRSGDLGFFHEGELFISGRIKDMIILHGRNIYPQDIEYLAESAHPALRHNASAAFSVDMNGEEKLVIVAEVERSAIMGLDVTAVCDSIRENIALETEQVVHAIQLIRTASILKTSSGKVQRKACKEAFLNRQLDVVGESLLETLFHSEESSPPGVDIISLEAWLMSWIHERLKIPLVHLDSARPITAYGLTSMKAIALQQDFLIKYGIDFPPYLFFEKTSLRQLCEKAVKLIEEK